MAFILSLLNRKIMTSMLATAVLLSATGSASAAEKNISLLLDGVPLSAGSSPVMTAGATLVPFRAIAQALGIQVVWEDRTKTVTARGHDASGTDMDVRLTLGQKTALVNGTKVPLTAAPVMKNGTVMIPLAFFGRQFGAQVAWDAASSTVTIQSPAREMKLLGFYAISSYDQKDRMANYNEIAFGWSQIDDNGGFTLSDTNGTKWQWPKAAGDVSANSIIQEANGQGSTSYLAVLAKDGKRQLTKLLTDATLRDASITQLHQTAKDNGFGGVMLDFEGLGWKDDPKTAQASLTAYVKQLRQELSSDGIKLSLAVPPLNGEYKGYDYAALSKYADELVIMAYDYGTTAASNKQPQPNDKVDQAIRLALDTGVPKNKLLLAVNLDAENETTVGQKLGLAKRYGLGGAATWRLGIVTDAEQAAMDRAVTKAKNE